MRTISLRDASVGDCEHIAQLYMMASDGLADYVWHLHQDGETDLVDVGARRFSRRNTRFSFENCLIGELDGRVVAMAHCYEMDTSQDVPFSDDPVLAPFVALRQNKSLFLSGLAVYREHRTNGVGNHLMTAVFDRAREKGLPEVSLICFEENEGALRLYKKLGFQERARKPVVPHRALHYSSGDVILMTKRV